MTSEEEKNAVMEFMRRRCSQMMSVFEIAQAFKARPASVEDILNELRDEGKVFEVNGRWCENKKYVTHGGKTVWLKDVAQEII